MKPVIAVSTSTGLKGLPSWLAISAFLRGLGAKPVRVASDRDAEVPHDALLLAGGEDLHPEHYGGNISLVRSVDQERDLRELRLLEQALKREIPILGICRGAHLINVFHGGELVEDLEELGLRSDSVRLPLRIITVEENSNLAEWLDHKVLRVNAIHHQTFRTLGKDLLPEAHARDNGLVQGIASSTSSNVVGVQWHPEYMPTRSSINLFRSFLDSLKQ